MAGSEKLAADRDKVSAALTPGLPWAGPAGSVFSERVHGVAAREGSSLANVCAGRGAVFKCVVHGVERRRGHVGELDLVSERRPTSSKSMLRATRTR